MQWCERRQKVFDFPTEQPTRTLKHRALSKEYYLFPRKRAAGMAIRVSKIFKDQELALNI